MMTLHEQIQLLIRDMESASGEAQRQQAHRVASSIILLMLRDHPDRAVVQSDIAVFVTKYLDLFDYPTGQEHVA